MNVNSNFANCYANCYKYLLTEAMTNLFCTNE